MQPVADERDHERIDQASKRGLRAILINVPQGCGEYRSPD